MVCWWETKVITKCSGSHSRLRLLCSSLRTSPPWQESRRSTSKPAKFTFLCPPKRPCSPETTVSRSGRWTLIPESAGRTRWWAGPPRKDPVLWSLFPVPPPNWSLHFPPFPPVLWLLKIVRFRADPLSNMVLSFSSKEDAIAFAEKNGNMFSEFIHRQNGFPFLRSIPVIINPLTPEMLPGTPDRDTLFDLELFTSWSWHDFSCRLCPDMQLITDVKCCISAYGRFAPLQNPPELSERLELRLSKECKWC